MINNLNGYLFKRQLDNASNDDNYSSFIVAIVDIPSYIKELEKQFSYFSMVRFFSRFELINCKQKRLCHFVTKVINKNKPKKRHCLGFKRGLFSRYRNPQTLSEIRNICSMEADGMIGFVRRRRHELPTKRDSMLKSNSDAKNWKTYRKKQYK